MTIEGVCKNFKNLWNYFPDKPDNSGFRDLIFKKYCHNDNCDTNIKKINAGCLWLFDIFFGTGGIPFYNDSYKHVVICIMIWLSYKLNQKTENGNSKLTNYYSNNIADNPDYTEQKIIGKKFKSYKEIIDQIKEYMDIDINEISKFYELLKLLCNMDIYYKNNKSTEFIQDAEKFVEEYGKLRDHDNNTDNSSYNKILHVLSNYYNNFEKYRVNIITEMKFPPLSTEKTSQKVDVKDSKEIQTTESFTETEKTNILTDPPISNTALSGSSLVNKIILVLSVFGAIAFFLGISYKYSLFGFRKRSKKQQIRGKLKK
ncbi:PIR protein [Plasmodium yoelii]|uniref:PIR protein n=3 Tax=Plasmodium yoelii TaxID=5861 RepID=A0AAF0B3P0_PLAYO|nr:PIR protein [Plasmodium yoelii]EAA21895.1 putative bir1 protein [Plasmodium yoelii yoelii]WBY57001.1 PIR protein [Plasmodium yoelii yoelii]CDS44708.1 YIR protein [Plasmodium yoelii]VTZ77868.1 PIR protein [Plasmodium yoelii]|eukprot:XP_034493469.1 PIR protein [Plasmodium yoelii]